MSVISPAKANSNESIDSLITPSASEALNISSEVYCLASRISADKCASTLTKSELVAEISATNASDTAEASPFTAAISEDTNALMSDALAICAEVTFDQFTVVKKSAICFERICAILII